MSKLLIAFALMAIIALTLASPRPEPVLDLLGQAAGAATGAAGLAGGLQLGLGAGVQGQAAATGQAAGAAQSGLGGVPLVG